MLPNQFDTLSEAINSLQSRGFDQDFLFDEKGAHLMASGEDVIASELTIVEHHRFEGVSDGSDMSVVYGVLLKDGRKGTIVDGFGVYSNPFMTKFMEQIQIKEES